MEETKKNKFNGFLERMVRARLWRQNKNWLGFICGETGSGKSYVGLALGEKIDKNFSIDNVCFTPLSFLNLLKSGKVKKGSMILLEEVGVLLGARDWYTQTNKLLNYVIQTFRRMNIGVELTVPDLTFVDSQARKLFNTYIETRRIDYKNEKVYTKVFAIQNNPLTGKVYRKYYRIDGVKINPYRVSKPSKELIEAYEIKKKEYTDNLLEEYSVAIRSSKASQREKDYKKLRDIDIAKDILDDNEEFTKLTKKLGNRTIIDRDLLQSNYSLSREKATRIKKIIEKSL